MARFEIPLALVHDRFILALGGKKGKGKGAQGQAETTKLCEAYDSVTNHWFQIDSLPFTCSGTSAVVMNDQEVYLMPGNNRETQTNSSLFICHLDTGPPMQFPRQSNRQNYGYAIGGHRWSKLEVKNVEFVRSYPVAALSLGPTQMLIFGGASTKCFMLDTRSCSNNKATVEIANTQLTTEAHFGVISVHYTTHLGT